MSLLNDNGSNSNITPQGTPDTSAKKNDLLPWHYTNKLPNK